MHISKILIPALCALVMLCGAWRWNPADRAKATAAADVVTTAETAAATATNAAATAQAAASTATNASATATSAAAAAQVSATIATNAVAAGKSFNQTFLKGDGTTGTFNFVSGLVTNTP